MATSPLLGQLLLASRQANNEAVANSYLLVLERMSIFSVKDRNLLAPPGTPAEFDMYIMPAGVLTGDWAGYSQHDLGVYINGAWVRILPFDGMTGSIADEDIPIRYSGTSSSWVAYPGGGGSDPDTVYGKNAISTGSKTGGDLSINGGDNTKFDVAAGTGFVVDNATDPEAPVITEVSWSAFSSQTVAELGTQPVTYISVDSAGALFQEASIPDAVGRRTRIFLGVLVHSNLTNINVVNNLQQPGYDIGASLYDLMNSLGFRSESGNVIGANGANLSLNKSSGVGFKAGANFLVDPEKPHQFAMAALTVATFRYRDQDGDEGSDVTVIDPATYDNAGTDTAVPSNNNATIQRIFIFPSNQIRVQKGQEVFSTLAVAIDQAGTESFVTESNIAENGLFLGSLVVKKSATDLSNSDEAKFIPAAAIAGGVGFASTHFSTDDFRLQDSADVTKQQEHDISATATGTTLKIVWPAAGLSFVAPSQAAAEDITNTVQRLFTSELVSGIAAVTPRQVVPTYTFTVAATNYTTPGKDIPLLIADGSITIDSVILTSNLLTTGSTAGKRWACDVLKTGAASLAGTVWTSDVTELAALVGQSLDASGTLTDGQTLYANILSLGGPTNMQHGTWTFTVNYRRTPAA